jgi:hypothetical protein
MAKRYRVTLTRPERQELQQLISRGKADARKLAPARILLQADEAEGGRVEVLEAVVVVDPRVDEVSTRCPLETTQAGIRNQSGLRRQNGKIEIRPARDERLDHCLCWRPMGRHWFLRPPLSDDRPPRD